MFLLCRTLFPHWRFRSEDLVEGGLAKETTGPRAVLIGASDAMLRGMLTIVLQIHVLHAIEQLMESSLHRSIVLDFLDHRYVPGQLTCPLLRHPCLMTFEPPDKSLPFFLGRRDIVVVHRFGARLQ